ncbi:odorant receptor [Trichonephila clavipes]|nr:odorant receptor [Trichonephila clavipes]
MDSQLRYHGYGYPSRCLTDRSAFNGVINDELGHPNGETPFFQTNPGSIYSIKMVPFHVWRHRRECTLAESIRHRHTGQSTGVMVWGAIGYTSRSPLVRIEGTLKSAHSISGMLRTMALAFI